MITKRLIGLSQASAPGVLLLLLLAIIQLTLTTTATPTQVIQIEDGALDRSEKEEDKTSGKQQDEAERLTIIAPKYLRSRSNYHVFVSLVNSTVPASVGVRLVAVQHFNCTRIGLKSVLANSDETQMVNFTLGDLPTADYILSVNAQAIGGSWNFTGEKQLIHRQNAKSFSAFIQTDKAIYKAGQKVQFRVLFTTETLLPLVLDKELNVTIQDARGDIIKQWLNLSNYRGLLSLEMPLSDDPVLGDYTIKVDTLRGQEFTKQFTVAEYVLPTFSVAIQLPNYATFNDSFVLATVKASYTYGKPVQGDVTLRVQPMPEYSYASKQYKSRLSPDGTADFQVYVDEDLRVRAYSYEQEMEFNALVKEDLTGRQYNSTQTIKIHKNKVKIERINGRQAYKPGMSQLLQYKVAYQDDMPVEDGGPLVELNYKLAGESIAIVKLRPRGGLIEHELTFPANASHPPPSHPSHYFSNDFVSATATYRDQVYHLDGIQAYQSQAHQYIQIKLAKLYSQSDKRSRQERHAEVASGSGVAPSFSVGDNLQIEVHSTEPMQQVSCQAIARNDIVWALNKHAQNKTRVEFNVELSQQMAPEMQVMCFRVRKENKELLADSIEVPVGGLVSNSIQLLASHTEAKPGEEVRVGVSTKPNSLVGVLGVDQSVLLLKAGNDLDQKEITNDVKSYVSPGETNRWMPSVTNAETLFDAADVVVLTNNWIYTGGIRFVPYSSTVSLKQSWLSRESMSLSSVVPQAASLSAYDSAADKRMKSGQEPAVVRIRSLFPETWLWQNGTADSQGRLNFSAKVPDTITSWQLSAFSLDEQHGLALSSGPTSIRVFRPFFIKLNLPYSMIRGEIVSIQAIVFNYSKKSITAKVTLYNQQGQFEFVEAANRIEDEKLASSSSESRQITIQANDGAPVSFLIKPLKLGHVDVHVVAQGDTFGDALVKQLLIKPPGQVQHFNRAMLVQLSGPGSSWSRNVTIEMPASAVDGSQKVFVSAIGDILGAGLSNTDDLLRLPYGCGEQNMINLVPNIVLLNYLQSTKRLRDHQQMKALRNIETGYQRELNYKRSDGSFSAFGPSDSHGSVWLTAYVLKTFQQARSIVTVDESIINQAASFIGSHSLPDGSIEEVGMLHHKALASSSLSDDHDHDQAGATAAGAAASGHKRSVYLTAYAMIALLQKPISLAPPASPASDKSQPDLGKVIERGLDYLDKQLERDNQAGLSTYDLAIITYAMSLAGSKRRQAFDSAYNKLWARASEQNDVTWWSSAKSSGNSTTDKVMDRSRASRGNSFVPNSLDVEISSLALLSTVQKRQDLDRALPIVRWLVSQQNSQGGFASTQDTVLAIEALAAFAEVSTSGTKLAQSIDVELKYSRGRPVGGGSGGQLSSEPASTLDKIQVTQANALVQQQVRLPDNITWVQLEAVGSGSASVQVSWQYNLLTPIEEPAFYLNSSTVLNETTSSSNVNYLQLNICTHYKGSGESSSNMAVVEVDLPSGYVADVESLPSLKSQAQIKRIDTEASETRVIVYLDKVTRSELCFVVPAFKSSKVANNKPVPIIVYDYYDRKRVARIFYAPKPASSCEICDSDSCKQLCANKSA